MLTWLETNSDSIVALFGAGGAGAILLAALFARSKKQKDSKSKPSGTAHQATAGNGGMAIVNDGSGNVSVNANEAVDGTQIQNLASGLDLSLHDTSKLLLVFERADVSVENFDDVVNVLKSSPEQAAEFLGAVKDDDKDKAAKLLKVLIA